MHGPPIPGKPGQIIFVTASSLPRYALNYKGIPYRSGWFEYPDIEGLCQTFNTPASATREDGVTPNDTVTLLRDSSTETIISASATIVEYLEATYPDTLCLIPPEIRYYMLHSQLH
ncbi:hypothetical protein ARMSODRAFT_340386 [Armillaria solidipes]|uniref:GST N-terminal domain-containing protein n=1 Tax=Armillaria solidipes TaxID=1076256 RepID=A0A2H3BUG6_9AGAR|nr:hypothetical protein ARMSODRAFT_340386 [Armillaria solidipes]